MQPSQSQSTPSVLALPSHSSSFYSPPPPEASASTVTTAQNPGGISTNPPEISIATTARVSINNNVLSSYLSLIFCLSFTKIGILIFYSLSIYLSFTFLFIFHLYFTHFSLIFHSSFTQSLYPIQYIRFNIILYLDIYIPPPHSPPPPFAGKPVFVTGLNITTGNVIKRTGTGIARETQIAIAEDVQYIWDCELLSQNVSVVWRTETDNDPLRDFSGSAVCLNEIQDRTCVAICFQNFETGLSPPELLKADHRKPQTSITGVRIKIGFLLPPEILNTEILGSPFAEPRVSGTYPSRLTNIIFSFYCHDIFVLDRLFIFV